MVNPYPFHNAKKGQTETSFTRNHKIFMAVLFLSVSKLVLFAWITNTCTTIV